MGKELKLVYTPLHGTGKMLGEKALEQAGFEKFCFGSLNKQSLIQISQQLNHQILKNTLPLNMRSS